MLRVIAYRILVPGRVTQGWTTTVFMIQGVQEMSAFALIIVTCIGPNLSLSILVCLMKDFMGLKLCPLVGISQTVALGDPGLRGGRPVAPSLSAIWAEN